MNVKAIMVVVLVSVGFLHAGAVAAQDLVDATDPAKIQNLASGYGSAQLTTDSVGDPFVRGRIDGAGYGIYFYGCTDGNNCRSIQFAASWGGIDGATRQKMEQWNQENRFGYAYLDGDGDPVISWDVNLFGGVSVKNLDDTIDWWAIVLKKFEGYIRE